MAVGWRLGRGYLRGHRPGGLAVWLRVDLHNGPRLHLDSKPKSPDFLSSGLESDGALCCLLWQSFVRRRRWMRVRRRVDDEELEAC